MVNTYNDVTVYRNGLNSKQVVSIIREHWINLVAEKLVLAFVQVRNTSFADNNIDQS